MVFIAQNDGIASIDISSTQPVVTSVVIGKYGACATAPGGKTVYAANLNSPGIDRIDVGTPPTVTSVISGMSPSQLWISSDGHWLYASDSTSGNLIQIDLSVDPPNIVNPFLSSISGILSLRTTAAGTFIYLAEANKVRRIDEAGATTEFQIDTTPVSTAFTSDGQYYYVINRTSAQAAELIVFDVETMSPIAHVPLGDTYGVAVVPHRLRAYVTNASPLTSYAPSITVVDATMDEPDSRRALCEVLSGRCPTPDKPCVNLAVVKLADGSIGEIDSCSFRPVVYSNSTLLDMILCLAENSDGTGTGVKSADAVTGTPVSATYDPQTGNIHFVIPPGTTGNDGISVKSADAEIGTPMSAAFDPGTGNIHFVLPPGIPGSDGITVKSADAETGTPVSATFDSVTGNIHFVIPPGKDGNPGTGINPNLAKITKTSWAHEDTWPIDRFITDGLNVDFSAPVFSTSNNSRGWFVVTVEYPIRILSTAPLPYLQESTIFVQHVLGNTNITGSQIYFLPDQNFRNTFNDIALQSLQSELPILCRVVIKCNYLTDNTDNIDGDFLNNQFPTGDGIPGGDFESWFFLTPSTNPPANPVSVSSSRAVRRVKPK
jgi:hypothetical protein